MIRHPSRRRFIRLVGAMAGAMAGGWVGRPSGEAATSRHEWSGTALGANARITLYHPDKTKAERLIRSCLAEIDRLEAQFSLFRRDSALNQLNAEGSLRWPSHDMRRLMGESIRFGHLSGGRFDVTIQPLWSLYASNSTPSDAEIAAAVALVDYRKVEMSGAGIRLGVRGMAVSLNGIAQGYITDCVADLLRSAGINHVLLDLGEMRALGGKPDGAPWSIGLRHPIEADRQVQRFDLVDQALATSADEGAWTGRTSPHIFDPPTGRGVCHHASVSVLAERATTADALSTTIFLAPPEEAQALLQACGGQRVLILEASGGWRNVPSFPDLVK